MYQLDDILRIRLIQNNRPGTFAVPGLCAPLFDFHDRCLLSRSANLMGNARIGDFRILGKQKRFGEKNGEGHIPSKGR